MVLPSQIELWCLAEETWDLHRQCGCQWRRKAWVSTCLARFGTSPLRRCLKKWATSPNFIGWASGWASCSRWNDHALVCVGWMFHIFRQTRREQPVHCRTAKALTSLLPLPKCEPVEDIPGRYEILTVISAGLLWETARHPSLNRPRPLRIEWSLSIQKVPGLPQRLSLLAMLSQRHAPTNATSCWCCSITPLQQTVSRSKIYPFSHKWNAARLSGNGVRYALVHIFVM